MEHSVPLETTFPNFQDQDDYSIPEDDLHSDTSNNSDIDNMDADDDLTNQTIATQTTNNSENQAETNQEPSGSSQWTKFTT
jgi:hypothetical protein